ncbi:hypothetical protein LCGC14_0174920 [marine sediment metagenome]|uniref:Uncharacterized protein n=1 Tax=marine sediment metagenome TaxID=412755 RepID=A0A0F9XTL4_9ZZZZ
MVAVILKPRLERVIKRIPENYLIWLAFSPIILYFLSFYNWLYDSYLSISSRQIEFSGSESLIHPINAFIFVTISYWVVGYVLLIFYEKIKERSTNAKKET